MSDPKLIGLLTVPSLTALLLLVVASYLYRQSRQPLFRAWQLTWALYCGYWACAWLELAEAHSMVRIWLGEACLAGTALALVAAARTARGQLRRQWYDSALVVAAVVWAGLTARAVTTGSDALFQFGSLRVPDVSVNLGVAALVVAAAFLFYGHAVARNSLAFRVLAAALGFWAVLLTGAMDQLTGAEMPAVTLVLGQLPQMVIGIAMAMVLYEDERRTVQDNLLAFSGLDVDTSKLLRPDELAPSMERLLERLLTVLKLERGALWVAGEYRATLPLWNRGLTEECLSLLRACGGPDALETVVYRRGGLAIFDDPDQFLGALPAVTMELRDRVVRVMARDGIASITAVSVQSATRSIGVLVFPRSERNRMGPLQTKILMSLAMQIGMTLDNYLLMQDAQRRSKEYALLTQIGQVVASHLDPEEILRSIHRELGQLFNNENFYVAFADDKEVRYELEVEGGQVMAKRSRPPANGVIEHILRSGQPLLVRSGMEAARSRLGLAVVGRAARCYCGVPIFLYGKPAGVMAALSYDRENVFEERDLGIMTTAAGQLAVAMENARLFREEQHRARYLGFLHSISTTAISSQDSDQMLAGIVAEIQKNFNFDHIGIGLVEYASKEIEIKAEAGTTAHTSGRRIPLGVGIIGRVARSGDMALVQSPGDALQGILRESRSVLCIPMTYGETLLGVLNVESERPGAFSPQDVLILRTLADLLATALHNVFIFQRMQQQSITDALTGVKTRRYFIEAVQSEWKRASRTGRPFSVVLIDLDKFKEVNDVHGHLEGDLVLARVGRLLEQKCRQSNVVARYGGDEFVILMPETGVEQAQTLAERLRLWMATDPMLSERKITGSFGVASYPAHGATVEDIIRVADAGMYVSKHAGGNRVSTAEELVEADASSHDQVVRAYVEGFLRREQTGMDSAEELVTKLKRLSESLGDGAAPQAMVEAIQMLNRAAEARESRGVSHGEQVARYAEMIARALGLVEEEINDVVFAARVHDVGKIVVPESVLRKPDQLNNDEYEQMTIHAQVGGEIVSTIPGSSRLRRSVRHHHEHFDGGGYPDRLCGEEIPLTARILAVADTYADMIADKPFGNAMKSAEAIPALERLSGTQLDGMLVRLLVQELKAERVASPFH